MSEGVRLITIKMDARTLRDINRALWRDANLYKSESEKKERASLASAISRIENLQCALTGTDDQPKEYIIVRAIEL